MALVRKNYHFNSEDLNELNQLNDKLNNQKSMAYHIRLAIKEYNKSLREKL